MHCSISSSLVIRDKTDSSEWSKGWCLFTRSVSQPMSDTRQAVDRVASWYCQRCDSFSTDGIVSSGRRNMAEMFGAISDDFWDALAWEQTSNLPCWLPLITMETHINTHIIQSLLVLSKWWNVWRQYKKLKNINVRYYREKLRKERRIKNQVVCCLGRYSDYRYLCFCVQWLVK